MSDSYAIKQIIIIRTDLRDTLGHKLPKGKLVAQGAHASLKIFFDSLELVAQLPSQATRVPEQLWRSHWTDVMIDWKNGDFAKIVLGCDSLEELLKIIGKAKKMNLPHALIIDNGSTCFGGVKTTTAAAIGPAPSEVLNEITGHLKLFM